MTITPFVVATPEKVLPFGMALRSCEVATRSAGVTFSTFCQVLLVLFLPFAIVDLCTHHDEV